MIILDTLRCSNAVCFCLAVNKQTDFGHRTSWMHSGLVGIVAVWLIAGGSAVASSDVLSGTFRVVDGDTLKVGQHSVTESYFVTGLNGCL